MKKIVFQDEIVLYWDKEWALQSLPLYRVYLNGKMVGATEKTHFTLYGLIPETDYEIKIERMAEETVQTLFCERVQTPKARKRIDVTKPPYNAVGDGKTVNTLTLQRAIDDCKAGETVYLPEGTYLSGALRLHSDMELYVDKNAVLQGVSEVDAYLPKIKSRFEGIEMDCYSSLLNMGTLDHAADYNCENIVIRGGGAIYGGGVGLLENVIERERENMRERLSAHPEILKEFSNERILYARARGRLINISNCKNVIISDLSLGYGAAWNVHFTYSKEIVTCNASIRSEGVWNGDGWDPDSSEDCTIFNVDFCTHDDAIAIKSGKNPEGNVINRPTKNIRVFDCRGRNGIAIGSELSGGVSKVYIWDCSLLNGVAGFRIKTNRKRGGYAKDVKIKDCRFAEVRIYTGYACNDDGAGVQELTDIENVCLENVESFGHVIQWQMGGIIVDAPCVVVSGFEEKYIKNLSMKNMRIHARGDNLKKKFDISNVENLILENLCVVNETKERK